MNTLRVVIVEDEAVTARNLAYLLNSLKEAVTIVATLSSVAESIDWFSSHPGVYDLIFMDIRLADGLSFDIFKKITITRPVIFVTAYNDYALQAFKNNGIDYILKPFDKQEIESALQKLKSLVAPSESAINPSRMENLLQQFNLLNKAFKKSFLVHYRDKLIPIEAAQIHWFYTAKEIVYARMADDKQYVMGFTMEQLEQQIDPQLFFRANRQFIVNRKAITEVEFYFNGRLMVKVKPLPTEHILISKARVPEFKSWMNS